MDQKLKAKHLCEHAQAMIAELKEQGLNLTLDECIWLNDLAREVENPSGGEHRHLAGSPSLAGDCWLWPFTIQGEDWLDSVMKWFSSDADSFALAAGYALAHGRNVDAFAGLSGYASTKKAIKKFRKKCNCTKAEFKFAVHEALEIDENNEELDEIEKKFTAEYNAKNNVADEESTDTTWADIIASMVAMTGLPEDIWLRQHSKNSTLRILRAINRQRQSESGESNMDANDPYVIACKNEGLAIREIKLRHALKEKDNGKQ